MIVRGSPENSVAPNHIWLYDTTTHPTPVETNYLDEELAFDIARGMPIVKHCCFSLSPVTSEENVLLKVNPTMFYFFTLNLVGSEQRASRLYCRGKEILIYLGSILWHIWYVSMKVCCRKRFCRCENPRLELQLQYDFIQNWTKPVF